MGLAGAWANWVKRGQRGSRGRKSLSRLLSAPLRRKVEQVSGGAGRGVEIAGRGEELEVEEVNAVALFSHPAGKARARGLAARTAARGLGRLKQGGRLRPIFQTK